MTFFLEQNSMTDVSVACEQAHLWVTGASGEEQSDPVERRLRFHAISHDVKIYLKEETWLKPVIYAKNPKSPIPYGAKYDVQVMR